MFQLLYVKWGEPEFGTPSGTITWSADIGGELPLASGWDLDDIMASLRSAFDAWEDVAAIDFEEVVTAGDVSVITTDLLYPTVGQAGPFPKFPSDIFEMTEAFLGFSVNTQWAPNGENGTDFYAVAVHEIGHIIGLAHPTPPDSDQIMNSVITAPDLSDIDIAGAQYIYGLDDDDVPVDIGDYEPPPPPGGVVGGGGDGGGGGGGAIALLLGLLGLIAAFFTGGPSAAMLAAAQVGSRDEGDEATDLPEGYSYEDLLAIIGDHSGCDHEVGEDGMVYHSVNVADLMPAIDFTARPNPCGCTGLCEHMVDPDEPVEDYLI